MKLKLFNKTTLVLSFILSPILAEAQQVNTLYFMQNVPVRNYLNPAFQPTSDFYLGIPVFGYTQFSLGNNSIAVKDAVYKLNGKSINFMNEKGDKTKFYNALKPITYLQSDLRVNLLDFGFRTGDFNYWTFGLTQRVDAQFLIPKELGSLVLFGNKKLEDNQYNLKDLSGDISAYTEAAFGYSRQIGEKLSVGAKLKFLYGNYNISTSNTALNAVASVTGWTLTGTNTINYAGPATLNGNSLNTYTLDAESKISNYLKPAGIGGGIDLGFSYKPINDLTLSASVLDLGMISWKRNATNIKNDINFTFEGMGDLTTSRSSSERADSIFNAFSDATQSTATNKKYTTYTSPKLNIGAEYAFLQDRLSVGVLSRTIKRDTKYFEEVTASVNGRPVDWFNMSLSYSILNGRGRNIGTGVSLRTGSLNWFLTADYIPVYYDKYGVKSGSVTYNIPVGHVSSNMSFAFGVNIVLGHRRDNDHDGVIDKRDECPETPFSVIVDRKGCPVDTDGDGVPDYLDKCPKTPKEAYNRIDQNGCPVDNDSDGVADYKDKCPDTPKEAIAYVDSTGCVKDTDKDGVADFKDKCPGTPAGIRVDSIGCPIDTDGDGIADQMDKCPNTPKEAAGKVDKDGCPLDSDGDGVPDYLDKCPETPAEARGLVDKNGCPLDSDGDGVPDYIQNKKSKDSVKQTEVVSTKPTDNVVVKQPDLNPGLKKEYRNLFQKALQGIQFETGKYRILPKSYVILNQIAGVLIANPTYLVEIRGHTDNQGKKDANLKLSQNRSNAVMKYLISKGIDPKRFTTKGFGDTVPVTTNKTVKGRYYNRRVEFVVSYEEVTFE